MKTQISLDSLEDSSWSENLTRYLKHPPKAVRSILEASGGVRLAAVSNQAKYLSIYSIQNDRHCLYATCLETKRIRLIREFSSAISAMDFVSMAESNLFVLSAGGDMFLFDLEADNFSKLEGPNISPCGISCHPRSNIILTWDSNQVLLWSWPSCTFRSRLKVVDQDSMIVWAHYSKMKNSFIAGFNCGTVILWDRDNHMQETVLQPPSGINMDFTSFSLSHDGHWLIGGGWMPLLIVYSITGSRVAQVAQLPKFFSSLQYVHFLPEIHPAHTQAIILVSTKGTILVSDFRTSKIIKSLRSQKHLISNVSISGNGLLLGITYSNGSLKLYTMLSFFPQLVSNMVPEEATSGNIAQGRTIQEIDFIMMEEFREDKSLPKQKKDKETNMKDLTDREKWLTTLEEFDRYPQKHRKVIWIRVLKLPKNFSLLSGLLEKRTDDNFLAIESLSLNAGVLSTLKRTLFCLSRWSMNLNSVSILPSFILPFVKFFHPNILFCFEFSATIIFNWGRLVLECWPETPKSSFEVIEDILCREEPDLLVFLKKMSASPTDYAWPLISTCFYKVFTTEEWFIVWDNIISKPPAFMMCVAGAFLISVKKTLMSCSNIKQLKKVCNEESWISVHLLLKKSQELFLYMRSEDKYSEFFDEFKPLPQNGLPFFEFGCNKQSDLTPREEDEASNYGSSIINELTREELNQQENACLHKIKSLRRKHANRML